MAITISNGLLTELKTNTQTTNLQFGDLVGKAMISGAQSNGGGSGVGEWYFYSDEGVLDANPPILPGNAIFTQHSFEVTETFNPDEADGVNYLYFNVKDASGVDYTSQFQALASDGVGSITITQNGDTATYSGAGPGSFAIQNIFDDSFFVILTAAATQTKSSNNPYTMADPLTLTFS